MSEEQSKVVENILNLTKHSTQFKVGDAVEWLDQGPAIIIAQCEILDPIHTEDYEVYAQDTEAWPRETGWLIKLLETGEKIEVHEETLQVVN